MWTFFAIAMTFTIGLGSLVGFRLLLPLRLGGWTTAALWVGGQVLYLIPLATLALRRHMSLGRLADLLAEVGWIALGWLSVVVLLILVRDVALLMLRLVGGAQALAAGTRPEWVEAGRQVFLSRAVGLALAGGAALFTLWGVWGAYQLTRVVQVEVPIAGLHPDLAGLRLCQISDIHIGPSIRERHVAAVARAVQALEADLIVFTGDLADGMPHDVGSHATPLAALQAPLGKYFITGNHEYYTDPIGWLRVVEALGFTVLLNQHVLLNWGEGRLLLAGVTDLHGGSFLKSHESRPDLAIAGAPPSHFKVLLAHQPASVFAATEAGFDLVLSGHTHGGQYYPWNWVAGKANPYLKGLNRHADKLWIYVSQGTGFWGPPIRLGAPAEITLLTLVSAAGS